MRAKTVPVRRLARDYPTIAALVAVLLSVAFWWTTARSFEPCRRQLGVAHRIHARANVAERTTTQPAAISEEHQWNYVSFLAFHRHQTAIPAPA